MIHSTGWTKTLEIITVKTRGDFFFLFWTHSCPILSSVAFVGGKSKTVLRAYYPKGVLEAMHNCMTTLAGTQRRTQHSCFNSFNYATISFPFQWKRGQSQINLIETVRDSMMNREDTWAPSPVALSYRERKGCWCEKMLTDSPVSSLCLPTVIPSLLQLFLPASLISLGFWAGVYGISLWFLLWFC